MTSGVFVDCLMSFIWPCQRRGTSAVSLVLFIVCSSGVASCGIASAQCYSEGWLLFWALLTDVHQAEEVAPSLLGHISVFAVCGSGVVHFWSFVQRGLQWQVAIRNSFAPSLHNCEGRNSLAG